MSNFSRDRSSSGGSRSFSGGYAPRRGGFNRNDRGDRGPREMFKAVCANCGRECEVPFKPTQDKPVYCSECFEKSGNRDHKPAFSRPNFSDRRPQGDAYKAQFDQLNVKLDKIMSLLSANLSPEPEETSESEPQQKSV